MKKVIVVSSTPRNGGNSELLAQAFIDGALSAGNQVESVIVRDINLKYCIGCMYCQDHDACVLNDSMNGLYEKFQNADVLVFATPIYYYSVSGQLKTFLDRLNPLYPRENKFKDVYLLATAADELTSAMDGAVTAIQGWVDCFDGVSIKGVIRGVGVTDKGDIKGSGALDEAYAMGAKV
ncbi:MAG: flavodoxin family protein [Clostridiales bacterium]|nr:flavodoxin family protein [Clostridiales bacterium]